MPFAINILIIHVEEQYGTKLGETSGRIPRRNFQKNLWKSYNKFPDGFLEGNVEKKTLKESLK